VPDSIATELTLSRVSLLKVTIYFFLQILLSVYIPSSLKRTMNLIYAIMEIP